MKTLYVILLKEHFRSRGLGPKKVINSVKGHSIFRFRSKEK